jgi:hypothetical protein
MRNVMRQSRADGWGSWGNDRFQAARVGRVLGLIDTWPAEDPPSDLATRTLARIDQAQQQSRFD